MKLHGFTLTMAGETNGIELHVILSPGNTLGLLYPTLQ